MPILNILAILAGLASFICFIIVLVRLFQEKGALHGILGILSCGLYPFIWGWIHATRLNIKNLMLGWTAAIIVSVICNVVTGRAAFEAALRQQTTPATPIEAR